MALRAVLVDDERPALDELEYVLSKMGGITIVATFDNAYEALEYVKNDPPEVLFLDIDMPGINGVEFAQSVRKNNLDTAIIFATAYDHYAINAFDVDATDYILKPYDEIRIISAIEKVKKKVKPKERKTLNKLPLWQGDRIVMVDVDEILFCQMDGGDINIVTAEKKYRIHDTLSSLEDKLPHEKFFRTHRAFIVNLNKITEVSPYFNHTLIVKLEGCSDEIPVSRSNVKDFKDIFAL